MWKQNIVRTFLFLVFFSVGVSALCAAILSDELLNYYRNHQLLKAAEQSLDKLGALNSDYEVLLRQLEQDPNFAERIASVVLGTNPKEDSDTVYPKVTAEQLAAAKEVLEADSDRKNAEAAIPEWLKRSNEPRRRTILFLAGAFLIIISFVCFGERKEPARAISEPVDKEPESI